MGGYLREGCCGSDITLFNWNRDIRWARFGTVRLRCGPLKPRLTTFITAFPPEAERFLKLPKNDGLNNYIIHISLRVGLITNHDI